MHRAILGLESGDKRTGDHINHNTLDNRRPNLRIATVAQNCQNRKPHRNNKLGLKGVCAHTPRPGLYRAYIRGNDVQRTLGYFHDPIEAARVYDAAVREMWGEFAVTNFPVTKDVPPKL